MAILWMNLIIVYMFSLLSRVVAKPAALGPSPAFTKPNKFLTFIVILTFVLISGLRSNIGDTFFYMHAYINGSFTWEYVLANKDIGFGIMQMVMKRFTNDPQLMVFISALITNLLIVCVLYKYSRLFELSVFVYITSGLYIISMNGIRQFLASAIVFAATKYLFEGNWVKYFLVVFVAATIHQSAFILIPIYFIVRRKAWTTATFFLICSALLLVLGYDQFSGIVFSAIQDTQYGDYQNFNAGGANILRVVVQAAPLVLAFLGRKKLSVLFPHIDYVVNMSLLGTIMMVVATQNWIFARFIIYFGMYNIILIPWIVKAFSKKFQVLIYFVICVLYLVYFFYENSVILRLVYRSDFIKF
ncbi:Transmembrane protein EpsG [compost metagenome]